MKKYFSKEFFKGKFSKFRESHPTLFGGIVIGLIICAISAGVIFGAQAISNLWSSEPIDVEAQDLVVSSSNFTEPTIVEVGVWFPFTLRVENPNPDTVPDYEGAIASVTILADSELETGDVSLLCDSAIPLTVSGGNLVGVISCVDDVMPPEFYEEYSLQVLFNKLGEYVIQVHVTGVLGE